MHERPYTKSDFFPEGLKQPFSLDDGAIGSIILSIEEARSRCISR